MKIFRSTLFGASLALLGFSGATLAQDDLPPPLPIEPTGIIETLPAKYPERWFLVHDASFFAMSDGKVYVIDAEAETLKGQVKGLFNVVLMGNILQSAERSEIYAMETFHERGTRGKRTDVLTIWDQATLSPKGEVVWPRPLRFMGMPQHYAMLTLNDNRWLAVANFSPATSVTLVDLDKQEIISEIPTPGCVFTYPNGDMGFSSLCADGRFLSTELNADGSVKQQVRTEPFFDSDDTPIHERTAVIGNTAYFPSLAGLIHPVDISGPVAKVGEAWHLVPEAERAEKWLPGGLDLIDSDDLGRLYILMHPNGSNDSYQGGGPEIWVYDPAKKQRVSRITLKEWGVALAVSRGKEPWVMVTNPTDMSTEVYDALTGEFIRKISDYGQSTPLILHSAR
jgi:methylamine dehydrogenase heavy chain